MVGFSEKVNSSIGTAVVSNIGTSGCVSVGRVNEIRERDVVRSGIERSEKLILQIIGTHIPTSLLSSPLLKHVRNPYLNTYRSLMWIMRIVIKYLLFWTKLRNGLLALLPCTLLLKLIPLRVLQVILPMLEYSQITLIKLSLSFWNRLSSDILVGEIIGNVRVNY